MKRPIAARAVIARLRRRLEASGLAVWKATKREVARFGLEPGDHVVTSRDGIVETGSLERIARRHGALAPHEALESEAGAMAVRRSKRGPKGSGGEGQGSLPL